jgi:NADP-dependent 3-hydroxy acid dehydrogenase YdfG
MTAKENPVWFITGCSKGFGRILTDRLLETTTARVVATARNPETLEDLKTSYPDRLLILTLDVTNNDAIHAGTTAALKAFGRIDVLVNNAGYGLAGALEECSLTDIKAQYETNVFGLMAMTQAILPYMRQQKRGHIINLSSVAGLVSMPGLGIYNSTKYAVEGLSEALAMEVAPFGIKVTIIEPGPFRTDFAGGSLHISSHLKDYDATPVAQSRAYLQEAHENQAGDPVKAADIMIQVTTMSTPPLRLPLGNIAMDRIYQKYTKQMTEFTAYEKLARSADFHSA